MTRLWRLVAILLLLLILLPLNGLLARRHAPPPWPDSLAQDHTQIAVNMDLAELATLDAEALTARWQHLAQDGVTILRVRVPWALIEPQPDVWDWTALDQVLQPRGSPTSFRYILMLDGSPVWARTVVDADNPFAPPQNYRDFGRFAEGLAGHVRSLLEPASHGDWRVAYQIWHEPNIGPHWGARYADPQGYFNLLREAYHRIRLADPDAPILLAALAPTITDDGFNLPDPIFLDRLLNLGAGDFFDIAAGQAYGFDQAPEAPPRPDQLNFRRVELLHDVLTHHGLGQRPIFITAWGWWTPQTEGLNGDVSPWRHIPVEDLFDYQQRAWRWMRFRWPWAAAPAWVQYAPIPGEDPIRLGWVQRDATGNPMPAGQGLSTLAHTTMRLGTGTYTPGDVAATGLSPQTGWLWGDEAADPMVPGATFTLPFRGSAVALHMQRGPYKGDVEVWIDGKPAPDLPIDPATGHAYLFLYDPANRLATVPVARHLPDGNHVLRVRAQGGWGYWPLRGIVIDDRPHPKPWPFWPITAVLIIAMGGVLWRIMASVDAEMMRKALDAKRSLASLRFASCSLCSRGQNVLVALAAWLPTLALIALPFYMHPVRLGSIGLPLHELFIWLGLASAMGYGLLGFLQRLSSPGASLVGRSSRASLWQPHPFLDAMVLLLLVIGFFAAVNASEKGYAFYEWRVTFLTPALFYVLITRVTLRREGGIQRLGVAALLGGALVSVIALGQFITGRAGMAEGVPRVQALYGSANNLALLLGRLLPLAFALTWIRPRSGSGLGRRGLYGMIFVVIAVAGFLTFSKGLLFISIPVGLAILFVFQKSLRKPILALALLGALALIPFLNTPRLAQVTSGTGRFRIYLWQSAWHMWLDHPWLGVGPDNFLYAYRSEYVLPAAWEELNLSHPHNLIFDLLTRVGLLGFLAGMSLVLGTIWVGLQRLRKAILPDHPWRPWLLGLWAGFIAGMAHGLIDNSLFLPDLMVFSLLAVGVVGERFVGREDVEASHLMDPLTR